MKFYVTDALKGSMSVAQLLGSCGILELQVELGSISKDGYYFRLRDDDFIFELCFNDGVFRLKRNDSVVEFEASNGKPEGIYHNVIFGWTPTWIGAGANGDIRRIETRPTSIPIAFHKQAKKENLLPNTSFSTVEKFREKVLDCFYSIQDKISESKSQLGFWNITKGNNGKVISNLPKDETHVQSMIHGMLIDQMMMNSIEVIPEYQNSDGNLDFCLCAQIDNVGLMKLAVEFKHAKSAKLIHGLETQLPIYMNAIGAKYGIYGVFWFKNDYFNEPVGYEDKHDLEYALNDLRSKSSKPEHQDISIVIFDFTRSKSASNA